MDKKRVLSHSATSVNDKEWKKYLKKLMSRLQPPKAYCVMQDKNLHNAKESSMIPKALLSNATENIKQLKLKANKHTEGKM